MKSSITSKSSLHRRKGVRATRMYHLIVLFSLLGIPCCLFLQMKLHNDAQRSNVLLNINEETFRKFKNNTESGNDNDRHDHEEESNTTTSNSSEPVIDAVFTYVNGSDPMIQEQWLKYGRNFEKGRDSDFGQLRYAMRSVLVNAPYVRNFIIVVNSKESQTPSWLNATHPRIRIVEHKEIWDDPSTLPSFSSHQIEWNLMNIPNLAPLFLYLNDDFAIQTPLELPLIWPGPGQHVLYEAWEAPRASEVLRTPGMDTYGKSLAFVRSLYDNKYGRNAQRKVASHLPLLFNRTIVKTIKSDWPKEYDAMYRVPFRTPHDLQFQFAYQQYIRQHFKGFSAAPSGHVHFVGMGADPTKNARTFSEIKLNPRLFMCLQDGFADTTPSQLVIHQIHEFYKTVFPTEGPWELNKDDYYSEMIR